MADVHLAANLAALERVGGRGHARAVASTGADGEIEWADGAVAGVSLRGPRGLVRMHGRRDPVGEAARSLPESAASSALVVVIGAGAGFVVEALEARGFSGHVLVLEPSTASLRAMLSRRSWEAAISAGRLRILVGPEYDGWMDLWSWVGPASEAPPFVVHPVLGRERPEDVRRAADVVKRLLFNANANEKARQAFAAPYLLNTLSNLRHLVASRDVGELFGTFAGVPAFVLAAGPSLNRNLEELKPHRDGALVIAVDTALRPCLTAGVEPDLVVGVDPGEANLRHLAGGGAPSRTYLVAEPSLAPGSFDAFGDRVFTFRVDRHHPWPWLQEQGLDRAKLLAWGSVLTTALDLAVKLGCNPVVLFGADFAYTDGQPYCRGTAFEEDWARQVAAGARLEDVWRAWMRQPVITEVGVDGREVETSAHLQAFRDWVVGFCRSRVGTTFLNGTGAGVLGGIERMPARGWAIRTGGAPQVPARADECLRAHERLAELRARLAGGLLSAASEAIPMPWREWLTVGAPESSLDGLFRAFMDALPAAERARWGRDLGRWAHALGAHTRAVLPATARPPCEPFMEDALVTGDVAAAFLTPHYLQFCARRLEHLSSLALPLAGRHVLEVGAGSGQLTSFFLDRDCRVSCTDARPENLETLRRRFARCRRVEVFALDLDPPPANGPRFDVVFCYGTLYHLSNPEPAIDYLAEATADLLLIETLVAADDEQDRWVPGPPTAATPNDSRTGASCRPGRRWLMCRLRERLPFVYVPATQPNYCQFPVDWRACTGGVRRAVFVGSRRPLGSPCLLDDLPMVQERQP